MPYNEFGQWEENPNLPDAPSWLSSLGKGVLNFVGQGQPDFYANSATQANAALANPPKPKVVLTPTRTPSQDAVADMDASSASPLSLILQYMNSQGGPSYDMPDTSQAMAQAQIDPSKIQSAPDPYQNTYIANALADSKGPGILQRLSGLGIQTDRPLSRFIMGIGAAGSQDPIGTLLKMKQAEQEALDAEETRALLKQRAAAAARQANQPKRTIIPGVGIMEERPDGTMGIVPNDKMRPKAATGYQWSADGTRQEPIPGGPKDLEAQKLSKQLESNFTRLDTKAVNVIGAIDKAMGQVGIFSAGPVGQATSWLGGTPGADLEGTLDEIMANIGFAELEDMRKSSPTGGALGQVAVRELEFLQAVKGSLKQKQTPAQLRANLDRVKQEFIESRQRLRKAYEEDIASGLIQRGSQPSLEGGKPPSSSTTAPQGGSVEKRAQGYL